MAVFARGRKLFPLLGLLLIGCDGLLEENPAGVVTSRNFPRTASDALELLTAAYQELHNPSYLTGANYVFMVELPTPEMTAVTDPASTRGCWDVLTCRATNDSPRTAWQTVYNAINTANVVIDQVAQVPNIDSGLRARMVAEARWLRALHYFNLVRLFGGVPLRTGSTRDLDRLAHPRATADEVYELVVEDLRAAAEALPDGYPAPEFGRATRGAARALLGKVYLQRAVAGRTNPFASRPDHRLYWPTAQPSDLDRAIGELRSVIASGRYSLLARYGDLWNEATEVNSEVIFSVRNAAIPGQGMEVQSFLAPIGSGWGYAQFQQANGELPFYLSYPPGDRRREVSWLTRFVDVNGKLRTFDPDDVLGDTYPGEGPTPRKYLIERTDIGARYANPRDLMVLRYADVLLMLAEALNERNRGPTAEAVELVNRVRERAGVPPLEGGMGYAEFRRALYHERQWELTQEQQSWFDAARYWDLYTAQVMLHASLGRTNPRRYPRNTVPKIVPVIVEPKDRLLPIPQDAIDRNPELKQNPGW